MALNGNTDKKLLMRALARRRDNQFDNFFDRLITELFITGTPLSSHCIPQALNSLGVSISPHQLKKCQNDV